MDKKIIIGIVVAVVAVAAIAGAYIVLHEDDSESFTETVADSFTGTYDGTFGEYAVSESSNGSVTMSTDTGVSAYPTSEIVIMETDDAADKFTAAKATIDEVAATLTDYSAIDGNDLFDDFYGIRCDITEGGSNATGADAGETETVTTYTIILFAAYKGTTFVDAYTAPQVHKDGSAQTYEIADLVDTLAKAVDNGKTKETIGSANLVLLDSDFQALLYVYGNANNDGTIDAEDVEFVQNIVDSKTTWDSSANPLADVDGDGAITFADVDGIEAIINATVDGPVTVKNLNRYSKGDYWTETKYPVASFAMAGSANMFMMCKLVGINDAIKAISYSGTIDSTLYPEYQKYFCDYGSDVTFSSSGSYTYWVGNSATKMYKELLANHINDDGITAVFVADNYTYLQGGSTSKGLSESDVEELGVDVVRFKAAATDPSEYLSDLYMMCFLTKSDVSKIDTMVSWYSSAISDLNSKLQENVGVNTNQVNIAVSSATKYEKASDGTVTTYNYVSSGTSDYTAAVVSAGGNFALSDYNFGSSSSSSKFTDLGLWLEDYDIDKLIVIKTGTGFSWYGGTALTDGKETLQACALAFSNTEMYYNGEVYIVSGDMPVILRTLYSAYILYPEIFSEEWVDAYNESYCTNFLGMTASDLSNGKWTASMEELGLEGHRNKPSGGGTPSQTSFFRTRRTVSDGSHPESARGLQAPHGV